MTVTQTEYDYIWDLIDTLRSAWVAEAIEAAPVEVNRRTFIDAAEWLEKFINPEEEQSNAN